MKSTEDVNGYVLSSSASPCRYNFVLRISGSLYYFLSSTLSISNLSQQSTLERIRRSAKMSPQNNTAPNEREDNANIQAARQLSEDYGRVTREIIGVLDQSIQRSTAMVESAQSSQVKDEMSPGDCPLPSGSQSEGLCELCDGQCSVVREARDQKADLEPCR